MRAAINSAVVSNPLTGIARYAFELGAALERAGVGVEYWTWREHGRALRQLVPEGSATRTFPRLHGIGTALLPWLLSRTSGVDVFHFPNGDLLGSAVPRTSMIHDLAPFLFDDLFPPELTAFYRERTSRVVLECDVIAVNSGTTRDDLLTLFPSAEGRVHLTLPGCDHPLPRPDGPDGLPDGIRPGYLLTVGTIEPRKNMATLIRAYALLAGGDPRSDALPPLVICGGPGYRAERVLSLPRELGIESLVMPVGYATERVLATLFEHCTGYVHPALYEGFGLPVAEALVRGLPVAASAGSALSELFGGLYVPFDCRSPESIADAIRSLLEAGPPSAGQLAARSEAMSGMTWRNCARETIRLFERSVS